MLYERLISDDGDFCSVQFEFSRHVEFLKSDSQCFLPHLILMVFLRCSIEQVLLYVQLIILHESPTESVGSKTIHGTLTSIT
mgnify:CR=1 FL=1